MFQRRGSRIRDMLLLSGWLFADLLLALTMIFLISINGGQPPLRPSCATPSPGTSAAVSGPPSAAFLPGGALGSSGPASNWTGTGNGATHSLATSTPCPTNTPTPTPTPINCGLDLQHKVDIDAFTVANADGLRHDDSGAQQQFADQVKGIFQSKQLDTKIAGLAEIFGGNPQDSGAGVDFAKHAVKALQILENQGFVFSSTRTFFQPFWDGTIGSDQIEMTILFYQQSTTGSCA